MFIIILAFMFAVLAVYGFVPKHGLIGYIQSVIMILGILGFIYLAKLIVACP